MPWVKVKDGIEVAPVRFMNIMHHFGVCLGTNHDALDVRSRSMLLQHSVQRVPCACLPMVLGCRSLALLSCRQQNHRTPATLT